MNAVDTLFSNPALFFLFHLILTSALIQIIQDYLHGRHFSHHYVEELFCAMQTMIISYECGVIRMAYGDFAYALCLMGTATWYSKLFRHDIYTNPTGTFLHFVTERRMRFIEMLSHFAVQVSGSLLAFEYVKSVWTLQLMDQLHKEKLASALSCKSGIKVPLIMAILVEFSITLFHRFALRGHYHLPLPDAVPGIANVIATFGGLHSTGGYFNPAQATVQQLGCEGHTFVEFSLVYILAPMIAAFLVGKYGDKVWAQMIPRLQEIQEVSSDVL